jgi:hypothetical protein
LEHWLASKELTRGLDQEIAPMKTRRVPAMARVGLAMLAAFVSPAILRAQATPGDVMAAAPIAIDVIKADSAATSAALAACEKLIRDVEAAYDALAANIALSEEKLKAEAAKLKDQLATLARSKEKLLAELKDAKSSLFLMRIVAADRAAASKLLDAMKQRNASSLGTLLDAASSPVSIVSVDVLSPSAIKMIFKVGVLTQCVATRPNCGTKSYAIVK